MAYVLTGMGDAATASRNVQVIGSAGAGVATGLLASLTSGGATAFLGITAAAVPVIGAGLMAAVMLTQYLVANSGCGQTCIVTSEWANKAAAALQQVMDEYFALPAPRTQAQKAVAVAAFHAIWEQLVAACGQPGTGDAGKRCISDRQAGACTWKQKYAPVYPGQPDIGECWNWWNGYLGPIQADPVVLDPVDAFTTSVSGSIDSMLSGGLSSIPLWGWLAAAGVAAVALGGLD